MSDRELIFSVFSNYLDTYEDERQYPMEDYPALWEELAEARKYLERNYNLKRNYK